MSNNIAYVLCGGNSQPIEFPGTIRFKNYVHAAITVGPQIKAAGLKRLFYHNPGGFFYLGWTPNPRDVFEKEPRDKARAWGVDDREMHVNQWLLAEQAKCPYANRKYLKLGHQILREYFDIEEVIYYIGSPEIFAHANIEAKKCVEMFLACGEGVTLGFDATAWDYSRIKAGDDVCQLFEWLHKQGAKVLVEPRLNKAQIDAGVGQWVDGTYAEPHFDDSGGAFKPDLKAQPGETIRGALPPDAKPIPGITLCVHDGVGLNWGPKI